MNAIEIRGLTKSFGEKQALASLDMTVPVGAIYGFIGENGSGKSTTEKIICGLIRKTGGTVKILEREHTDPEMRARMGVLIEAPGCFPSLTVWENMKLQAANLGLEDADTEIIKMLKTVRMEGAAGNKYKNCSLGMKQRVGIAMALLGNPSLLVLDEPINGLDADGMRIMREVLRDIAASGATIVISSHVLGELQKVATHYGIIRHGRMLCEMTAEELDADCPVFVALRARETALAKAILSRKYIRVEEDEAGRIRVYDKVSPEEVVVYLAENGVSVSEIDTEKIGLEEYYDNLMREDRANGRR